MLPCCQTVLLDSVTAEFRVLPDPFNKEPMVGVVALDSHVVVYSQYAWTAYSLDRLDIVRTSAAPFQLSILKMEFRSLEEFSMILWTGGPNEFTMKLVSTVLKKEFVADFHTAIVLTSDQKRAFVCGPDQSSNNISLLELKQNKVGNWSKNT